MCGREKGGEEEGESGVKEEERGRRKKGIRRRKNNVTSIRKLKVIHFYWGNEQVSITVKIFSNLSPF